MLSSEGDSKYSDKLCRLLSDALQCRFGLRVQAANAAGVMALHGVTLDACRERRCCFLPHASVPPADTLSRVVLTKVLIVGHEVDVNVTRPHP